MVEDTGTQQYYIGDFLQYRMVDDKSVSDHLLINNLRKEDIELPEWFVTGCLIEKLPESWRDSIKITKHKKELLNLEEAIVHIRIDEQNGIRNENGGVKELHSKANLIDNTPKPNKRQYNPNQKNKKKSSHC